MINKLKIGYHNVAKGPSSIREYEVDAYITIDLGCNSSGRISAVYSKAVPVDHVINAIKDLRHIPLSPTRTIVKVRSAYVASPEGLVDYNDTTYGRYTEKEIK